MRSFSDAAAIVDAILQDLKDRRTLRQVWEEIDGDVQGEIRDAWILAARKIIKKSERDD